MSTYADRYATGVKAFSVLTGELDKAALKDAVRDGFAALLEWSEKTSGREIAKTSGRSVNQVARDIRAARFMADHPKADPVATIKACNVLSAGEVAKADGPKALAEMLKKKSGETAKGRKARGKHLDQTETGEDTAKGKKGSTSPEAAKALTSVRFIDWVSQGLCSWTPAEMLAAAEVLVEQAAKQEAAA